MYRHTIVCLVMYRDTIHDKKQNNNVVIYVLFKSVRPVPFCPWWFVPLLYGKGHAGLTVYSAFCFIIISKNT